GSGTFSEVWRAVDEHATTGRRTAVLKVFLPSARGSETLWPTVRRESEAAARLAGTPRCLLATAVLRTSWRDGTEVPVLVLPDVDGVTLADWLARDPRPGPDNVGARLDVLRDVLAALAGVHAAGAAHRDVGFGNVLVAGPAPRAWLTDFGACQLRDAGEHEVDRGDAGLRPLQPPPYGGGLTVADEQDRDLYAFGVLATLALTGRHPLTDAWQELTPAAWTGPADPHRVLPRRPMAELAAWLMDQPRLRPLDGLLAHCVSPSPGPRPPGAAALLLAWPAASGWR
ncbi:MAG: putative serine/threonine protein kinase, partial [Actinotalea sp.]|nr:putative serine/threonine protein kinase [Actinotalea sp.]